MKPGVDDFVTINGRKHANSALNRIRKKPTR